ncbi:DUF6683 family protein [Deinococcus sp.]|uniref:DUF6683 family protein n=1 Tax=Deinococcus sp. TaxID=47478 RepID=UPI002600AF8A|nr:DUF6683 family protein [Deinococcus sp.]
MKRAHLKMFLATTLMFGTSAFAEDSFASLFSSVDTSVISSAMGSAAAAPAGGAVDTRASEYKPSAKVSSDTRELIVNVFIKAGKASGKLTPALEDKLRTAFSTFDVARAWGKSLEPKGFKMNSLATGTAIWVSVSFRIMSGKESSDAQDAALLRQFQVAFSKPAIAKMSDAEKQRNSELLMWMAALQDYDAGQLKAGAPGYTTQNVQKYIGDLLRTFKLDPAVFEIGDKGLQRKGG